MKFTVVSHACLYVEHGGVRLLVDPWIVGSCYWRSWWNFPEPPASLVASLRPTHIYLTHLHWDHFHGPSLRRFDRATRVLVPRTLGRRMVEDLRWLGFDDVDEIEHGGSRALGDGLSLHSFQFNYPADSGIVVTDGRTTLFDANDAKFFGPPLRHVLRRFGEIDFVFRSHSSASPLPYCIEGYEQRFPEVLSPQDFIDDFTAFGLHVAARYAIPFASNHCFLHKETRRFNATGVDPGRVAAHYNATAERAGRGSRAVVMAPGSSWEERAGFSLVPFDYARAAEHVEAMAREHAPQLEAQYALEDAATVDEPAFHAYFEGFLAAIPLATRLLARRRFVFEVRERAERLHLAVDLRGGTTRRIEAPTADDVVIEVAALVLNDCTQKRMFSAWTPSKRLHVRLPGTSLSPIATFLVLLDWYETGLLPLSRWLTSRGLDAGLRRFRDAGALAEALLRAATAGAPLKPSMFYPDRAIRS